MQITLSLLALSGLAGVGPRGENPIELGQVEWQRDHGAAFASAARLGRPVLLLFQEIPG